MLVAARFACVITSSAMTASAQNVISAYLTQCRRQAATGHTGFGRGPGGGGDCFSVLGAGWG